MSESLRLKKIISFNTIILAVFDFIYEDKDKYPAMKSTFY